MTTTARRQVRIITADTAALTEWAVVSGYDTCDLCPRTAAYLFPRVDEYGNEVRVCEHCVNTNPDLGHCAD